MTVLRAGSASDTGRVRTINQDSVLTGATVFAVADGMGGHAGGEVASATAVAALDAAMASTSSAEGLVNAIRSANDAIAAASRDDPSLAGMGTTVVAASLIGSDAGDVLVLANVGDSRGYLFHAGRLRQVTDDHSLAAEMVRSGDISEAEAARHPQRHVITRALGIEGSIDIDLFDLILAEGDRVLLCSDGLTNEISDEEIERVLSTLVDPTAAAEDLVRRANAHGGSDNISVVIIDAVIAEGTGESTAAHRIVTAPAATASIPKRETAAPGIGAISPPPVGRREGWLARRRRLGVQRAVTFRVLMFLVLLVGVLAGAWYFLRWYATSAYYVTAQGGSIVIYQGRPGGVLWFQPKLVTVSPTPLDQVLATRQPALRNDVPEPTLEAAQRYVANLADEYRQTQAAIPPAQVITPTTIPIPTPTVSPPITSAPGAIVTYPTLPR